MTTTDTRLTEEAVRTLVQEWYQALDRHAPVEEVVRYLADEGLVMHFPEGTLRGLDGFRSWYRDVTHRFFDEVHELTSVDVRFVSPVRAEVRVVVNWQTKVWNPPAPHSEWLGFDATQTWSVVLQDGTPRILTYTVDDLAPMPGSADLGV
ncbi:nuclear transport factor 2 family protein [Thermobifida cellulosilytica]|uniref:SnoaL-like domain-containing protein n=1 Tax=Thermobifida cellulosilytica TB100 TaxID=665004 RepID=A0A147KMP0_THECS|nr:nuclear transport factor 2 family protein [Thermobifida cellulosilytica]KUP98595.1 hypothetical protein AC529_00675 [Thermobifida cellulosilytica TB100]